MSPATPRADFPWRWTPGRDGDSEGTIDQSDARNPRKKNILVSDQNSVIIIGALQAGLEVEVLAEVRVQEGEPLENALRRFKRKVQTEDIIKEVKRHSYYLKPGEKRRVKAALARKRNRKKARKEQD